MNLHRHNARMMLLAGMALMGENNLLGSVDKYTKSVKECLVCKKEHIHNNCFCSAECCKSYKKKSKPPQQEKQDE